MTITTFHYTKTFAAALLLASCVKEAPVLPVPSVPSDAITFGVDDSFTVEVQTKAMEDEQVWGTGMARIKTTSQPLSITTKTTPTVSLASFYVSAVKSSSEELVWGSTNFTGYPLYTGGKYWPSSNPSWMFFASNKPLYFGSSGVYISATNDLDVVVAKKTDVSYKVTNTLNFTHIFSRVGTVTVEPADGFASSDITNINISLVPKTSGVYNLRYGSWSSITTGSVTSIANNTPGTKVNDLFLVPDTYTVSCSWTCKGKDFEGSGDIVFNAGEIKNINISLGGEVDYLTFDCVESGTITWKSTGGSYYTIQYSKDDGNTWSNLKASYSGTSLAVNAGDVVLIKGARNEYRYHSFSFSNKVFVHGNVFSLVMDCTSATKMDRYCFDGLFKNCVNLYTYEDKKISLPAIEITDYCYKEMFSGCINLTTAPELPATKVKTNCYDSMFSGCSSLTTAPELPATTLANSCYNFMFGNCISLEETPILPAQTLKSYCYGNMFNGCTSLKTATLLATGFSNSNDCYRMFYNCSSLNYIKALFLSSPGTASTNEWVYGVAGSGVFVKNSEATWNKVGTSGVPTGWTVVSDGLTNGHALVDLGLRSNGNKILFATMNIGASAPQEYGDYFAWGETSKRYTSISGSSVVGGSFKLTNCPYHTGSTYNTGWSKYIPTGKESYGTVDNKLILEAGDDVASILWGGSWRMPTAEELCMLINGDGSSTNYDEADNVTYSWTDDYNGTGVHGFIITGKGSFSSASLFLPATGSCGDTDLYDAGDYGYYWSRSVSSGYPDYAWRLYFADGDQYMDNYYRYYGLSVRPVLDIPE